MKGEKGCIWWNNWNGKGNVDLPKNLPMKDKCKAHLWKGRKLLVVHWGKVSPMSWVEVHLVDVIMTMALMQQPITPKLGIVFTNSMVEGTDAEHEINEWWKIFTFWQFQHRKWQWTWSIAWNEVVDEFYEVTPSSNIKESCLFWLNMWWQVYCSKLYDHVQGNVWSNGSEQSGN